MYPQGLSRLAFQVENTLTKQAHFGFEYTSVLRQMVLDKSSRKKIMFNTFIGKRNPFFFGVSIFHDLSTLDNVSNKRTNISTMMNLFSKKASEKKYNFTKKEISTSSVPPKVSTEVFGTRPIYLDVQATTPVDPRVLDAMLPYYTYLYGNSHSRTHSYGWETDRAVQIAREHVANLIGADPKEIFFTSGATESNNMIIKGVAHFYSGTKKHIITAQTEHKCVLDSCRTLQNEGFDVTYLPVDKKGVGASYIRRKPRVRIEPLINGGGQERGLRSGTIACPLVIGMGEASRIAKEELEYDYAHVSRLSKRLVKHLTQLEHVFLNGDQERHYPGCINASFAYVEGESLLMALKNIALSSGSACTSASLEPSYVIRSLGVPDDISHSSLRFGIGRFTTDKEIDYICSTIKDKVNSLRELSPLWEMVQEGIDLSTIKWSYH
ncbi:hypothetical protein PORY_002190 [Pneumocystis oryctolagi]|uniref:Uncharacterized protein n=1 Tax=Pneumocystis oryctolagi TaxID=42067 RepID=A0ACB7CBR1_9ASCO|nr:hypothetical protein PORY_002190 [Pneumocystis oryctolagi]